MKDNTKGVLCFPVMSGQYFQPSEDVEEGKNVLFTEKRAKQLLKTEKLYNKILGDNPEAEEVTIKWKKKGKK